jgi:hypothetical protein
MKSSARKECQRCRYTKAITSFHGGDLCHACQRSHEHSLQAGAAKRCLRCGESKPVGAYWRDRTKRDGLRPECKACRWMSSRAHLGRRGWHLARGTVRKCCFNCREEKPRSSFSRLKTSADGLAAVCRVCESFRRARRAGKLFESTGRILAPKRRTRWLDELIPSLAADLARRLSGPLQEAPLQAHPAGVSCSLRNLCATQELISKEQWDHCTALIGTGTQVREAIETAAIRPCILRRYLRASRELRAHWNYALIWNRRKNWSVLDIDDVLEKIATGDLSTRQACARQGVSYTAFIALTTRDADLQRRYLAAKQFQQLHLSERMVTIADAAVDVRVAKRQINQLEHRLETIAPARLRNVQRRAADPRRARVQDARRRAAASRRRPPLEDV